MNKNNLAVKIALELLAKQEPQAIFESIMNETKEMVKHQKDAAFERARSKVYNALHSDLNALGIPIHLLEVKLGKFRGHPFITSSKVEIDMRDEDTAKRFLDVLKNKYSPKFKLKSFSNGIAKYNIR